MKKIKIFMEQFYFGRKQKYLWKRCYTVKKPLINRASGCSKTNRWSDDHAFMVQPNDFK
jgi:hypothetical protein